MHDDFLWDLYFEQVDESENENGMFELELKNEERYYNEKYCNRNISDN